MRAYDKYAGSCLASSGPTPSEREALADALSEAERYLDEAESCLKHAAYYDPSWERVRKQVSQILLDNEFEA